jgi:coniferyl-aldehyde dehydrogenase
MPFGGIGNSGMGHYHGEEGFIEFSKLRPIFKQAKKSAFLDMAPPYGDGFEKITNIIAKWKLW